MLLRSTLRAIVDGR
jgi:hypothetical protein